MEAKYCFCAGPRQRQARFATFREAREDLAMEGCEQGSESLVTALTFGEVFERSVGSRGDERALAIRGVPASGKGKSGKRDGHGGSDVPAGVAPPIPFLHANTNPVCGNGQSAHLSVISWILSSPSLP